MQSYQNGQYDVFLFGLVEPFGRFESKNEPEGSMALSSIFPSFVIALFEALSGIYSNILLESL
jgi:hypothetical protein